jgi:hypothetical protein
MVPHQEREGAMLRQPAGIAVIALACALLAAPARSADTPPPAAAPDYHPSLGDLMTMAVQPRHIKLGAAGKDRNWAYVTYESSELRNAFGRIARTTPTYRQTKLADLFASGIIPTLDELDAAIKAKDAAKFDIAYGKLTEGCNTCHVALDHAYVVIRTPQASPYADQSFKALK